MPFYIFLYDYDGLNIKYYRTIIEHSGSCMLLPTLLSAYLHVGFSYH